MLSSVWFIPIWWCISIWFIPIWFIASFPEKDEIQWKSLLICLCSTSSTAGSPLGLTTLREFVLPESSSPPRRFTLPAVTGPGNIQLPPPFSWAKADVMFGAGDEDDTDFLSPSGGAKLASLFGLDQATMGHGNEFFQYTAPKQPKKGQGTAAGNQTAPKPAPATTGTSSVLFATAVHAYRYINGQYAKQGKFGAAVLGNHTSREVRRPTLIYTPHPKNC